MPWMHPTCAVQLLLLQLRLWRRPVARRQLLLRGRLPEAPHCLGGLSLRSMQRARHAPQLLLMPLQVSQGIGSSIGQYEDADESLP